MLSNHPTTPTNNRKDGLFANYASFVAPAAVRHSHGAKPCVRVLSGPDAGGVQGSSASVRLCGFLAGTGLICLLKYSGAEFAHWWVYWYMKAQENLYVCLNRCRQAVQMQLTPPNNSSCLSIVTLFNAITPAHQGLLKLDLLFIRKMQPTRPGTEEPNKFLLRTILTGTS